MQRIERPKSLTEMAAERIREDIVTGRIGLGEALSEGALAASLGISKTPIREALMRLQIEGLVTIVPQKGTFVFRADAKEIKDLCDVRSALEPMALRFASQRNPSALAESLQAIVAAMTAARDAGDTAEYLRLDSRFHACFFEHADNAFLTEAYNTLAAKMAALRTRLGTDPGHMKKSYEEHKAMARAIVERRLDDALGILEGHIGRKEGSYWDEGEVLDRLATDAARGDRPQTAAMRG